MSVTVVCRCGTRVRGETERLRRHPPCPECGSSLPFRPEPPEKKIDFRCICGLEMKFPESRGGLWFDCPQCGRRSIIPGFGSAKKRALAVALPPEPAAPRRRHALAAAAILAAIAAALAAALFLL